MKTIEQWLNELPEPYRSQALENCKKPDREVDSIHSALLGAFYWKKTQQGFEYWQEFLNTLPR